MMFSTPIDYAIGYGILGYCLWSAVTTSVMFVSQKINLKLKSIEADRDARHQQKLLLAQSEVRFKDQTRSRLDDLEKKEILLTEQLNHVSRSIQEQCRPFFVKLVEILKKTPQQNWQLTNGSVHTGVFVEVDGKKHQLYFSLTLGEIGGFQPDVRIYQMRGGSWSPPLTLLQIEKFFFAINFTNLLSSVLPITSIPADFSRTIDIIHENYKL